jgi:mannose-6-phosphate isomerase-like protein (cupin superfamily)
MPNYTVKNLKQVENMAEKFGMSDGLEARFAASPLELENFGLSYQRLEPNFRIPFGHKHGEQEEVYVVLSGSARLKLDDEIVELREWDAIRVPGEVTRNFEGGPEGAELLAIGAPAAKDTEMLQGWWTD